MVMNPPGKAYPGDPPCVEEIHRISVEDDELDRSLDPDIVYERHQESIDEALLRKESRREQRDRF